MTGVVEFESIRYWSLMRLVGMTVTVEKNGKAVVILAPTPQDDGETVIHRDGSISGQVPLTYRRNLGEGGY